MISRTHLAWMFAALTTVSSLALQPQAISCHHLPESERLKEIMGLIRAEIGLPNANDLSECRLIAVSNLCPYRQVFLAYSITKTNEANLRDLVARYNHLERQLERQQKPEQRHVCPATTPRIPKLELSGSICTAVDELKEKWERYRKH